MPRQIHWRIRTNIPSNALSSRLLAGVGTLALLAAAGLFASRPAHSGGGPVPVAVANPSLAVTVADVSVQQPYSVNLYIPISAGSLTQKVTGPTIPVGKTLIVQSVSAQRQDSLPAGSVAHVIVFATSGGSSGEFPPPAVPDSGLNFPGTTQALTFHADGGSALAFFAERNEAVGQEEDLVTVSGYLVDTP